MKYVFNYKKDKEAVKVDVIQIHKRILRILFKINDVTWTLNAKKTFTKIETETYIKISGVNLEVIINNKEGLMDKKDSRKLWNILIEHGFSQML
jgi:hypothetical protein